MNKKPRYTMAQERSLRARRQKLQDGLRQKITAEFYKHGHASAVFEMRIADGTPEEPDLRFLMSWMAPYGDRQYGSYVTVMVFQDDLAAILLHNAASLGMQCSLTLKQLSEASA